MEEEQKPEHILTWEEEDIEIYRPLMDAVDSGKRANVESTARAFTQSQFGVPPDDITRLHLPRYIRDETLQGDERQMRRLDSSVIVVLPPKSLVKKQPDSKLFQTMDPGNRPVWLKINYDDRGFLIRGASELTDRYRGLPPEDQDPPNHPELN